MLKRLTIADKLALFLFGVYFVVGLFIVRDIGFNWDDQDQHINGLNNVAYLFQQNKEPLRQSADRYHGPAFELLLIGIEKIVHPSGNNELYVMRHKVVFIYFAFCGFAFYFLIRKLFKADWLPLIACLMLVLQPRIFADSMYNPKDITALGAMIMALLTLFLFSRKPSWLYLLLHAFVSAWAVDIRVLCLMMPMATVFTLICKNIIAERQSLSSILIKLLVYLGFTLAFMIPMWPILIDGPFYHIWQAISQMSNYTVWDGSNLYFGKSYPGTQTPGEYQFVWFLMTNPVIYTLVFIIACGILFVGLTRDWRSLYLNYYIWLSLGFFIAPPAAMWLKHSVVLEGWRHVFLIYPFFVIVCVYGLARLFDISGVIVRRLTLVIVASSFIFNAGMIHYLHPFEYVYFNPLAVEAFDPLDRKFEIDYWGPSFKQGLEYVADHCYHGPPVKIAVSSHPGYYNYDFMPTPYKAKLENVEFPQAEYYISNHRWDWNPQPDNKLIYEFRRQGNRVVSIYKLR